MSQNLSQQQKPKSIEELEKKLYDINNDYKESIKKIIASNKSIEIDNVITDNIIVQDIYLNEINQNNNNVLNNIKDKIILFNELIDELKTIKPGTTKEVNISNIYLNGKLVQIKNTTTKPNYQPSDNNIVQKHIDYLEYLKKILETKLVNDIKIINLFKQVISSNTEKILQLINDISKLNKEKKAKQNQEKAKQIKEDKQKNLNEKLEKCSIEIKPKLNALSELSNVQYNTELTKYINKVKLDKELKICNKKIKKNLNNLINTLDNINVPNVLKKRGGSNFEITNDIIKKLNLVKLVNVSKSENYTGNLKNIKQIYENGLKQNIQQYKKICKALTVYIKDLQQIIKELLSSFIEEKQKIIEEQKQYLEQKENEIIEINKEINKIINEKIQEKNKENKENKTNIENIENIDINIIENRYLRENLEDIISKKDFFNDDNNILILTYKLIGKIKNEPNYYTFHGLTINEIKDLVPQIKQQLLKYKKLLEEIYSSNEK